MAGLVRRLLDNAPVGRPTRAQRRAARQRADDALVAAWLHQHGGIRPLEAFAVEVPLRWRRRQAALRRLIAAPEEARVAESIEWPDPTPAPRARRWERRTRPNARFRPAMELGFDDCDPIATCHCGARCKGDSIRDALTAWSTHLSTTHRGEW